MTGEAHKKKKRKKNKKKKSILLAKNTAHAKVYQERLGWFKSKNKYQKKEDEE